MAALIELVLFPLGMIALFGWAGLIMAVVVGALYYGAQRLMAAWMNRPH